MKILKIIKGFVTNSSSANYWLDDGFLEEDMATNSVNTYLNTEKENYKKTNIKQATQEPIIDLTIWVFFSLIIIFITLHKKSKK